MILRYYYFDGKMVPPMYIGQSLTVLYGTNYNYFNKLLNEILDKYFFYIVSLKRF